MKIDATAGQLSHDLAIDATGTAIPSRIAAGLTAPAAHWPDRATVPWILWVATAILGLGMVVVLAKGASIQRPL
jgi:hypothetical protein